MTAAFDVFNLEEVRRRLRGFIASQGLADVTVDVLRRFTVGFSWITFGFRASWRGPEGAVAKDLILRIGPPNGIFAPYKASPEFVTLQALAGSDVPAPGPYWFSDGDEVFGAPFFIAEFLEGEAPIPWTHDGGPAFDDETRRRLGGQFVAALAALHTFDWRETPVAGIGGSTDIARAAADQVGRWESLLTQWSRRRTPMLEWAAIWLRDNAPVAPRISIVHGDYRIGNFLVHQERINAILDWELVRLGDPIEDLGWVCLQAWRGRSPNMCHFFSREELRDRYSALSGIEVDLRAMRYWEAFGTYKLAVMHYGAAHCFEARGFNDLRMVGMGAQIPRMLLQVESALERAA